MRAPLLQVQHLTVSYTTASVPVRAARDVSFEIGRGETLALVGETGCGKSTVALALLGLHGRRGRIESGDILFEGRALTCLKEAEWRSIRGAGIGLVFQDPRSAMNPVLTIGEHVTETLRAHRSISLREARRSAGGILAEVGIPDPAFFMNRYPSELSGGLCQRVGIALAICNKPQLLIADEPTSALDPTIQAQVLELVKELKRRRGLALLLISHDLALVSEFADRVAVMYHGRIVECGRREEVLVRAAHPYTQALIGCLPGVNDGKEKRTLKVIPGSPPPAGQEFPGCAFAPRCELAGSECTLAAPPARPLSETRSVACIKA